MQMLPVITVVAWPSEVKTVVGKLRTSFKASFPVTEAHKTQAR